jgi:hypothetical protein
MERQQEMVRKRWNLCFEEIRIEAKSFFCDVESSCERKIQA